MPPPASPPPPERNPAQSLNKTFGSLKQIRLPAHLTVGELTNCTTVQCSIECGIPNTQHTGVVAECPPTICFKCSYTRKVSTYLVVEAPVFDSLVGQVLLCLGTDPKYPHLLFPELLNEFVELLEVALWIQRGG